MASQTRINGPVSADPAVSNPTKSTTTRRTAAKRTVKSGVGHKTAARQTATDTTEKYTAAAPWPTLPPEPEEEAAAPGLDELNAQDEASGDTEDASPEAAEAKAGAGQADAEEPSEAAGAEAAGEAEPVAAAESGEADATAAESPSAEDQRPVPDEELISLLERLSVTIDNAHQVLDEAAGINTQPQARAAQQEHMDAGQDEAAPEEQHAADPEEQRAAAPARDVPAADMPVADVPVADVPVARNDDDPYTLLDREIPASRPVWLNERPPEKPRGATSIALLVTLMLMAPVAGAGWFVYANPSLIAGPIASDAALAAADSDARRETAVTKRASASMVAPESPAGSAPAAEGKTQAPAEAAGKPSPGAARAAGSADMPGNATVESAPLPPNESLTPPDAEPAAVEVASLGPDTPQTGESGESDPNVIRGAAGQPIEVPLVLPPATARHEISIMVEGVPDGARLSVGKSIGRGTWILNGAEADSLALETDPGFEPERFPLGITMVKSDGKAPQVRSIDIEIEETGAAGPAKDTASAGKAAGEKAAQEWAPSGVPISKEQERALLARGETLLESGDVAAARLVFSYAAQRGSAPAMQALARSYDPKHLLKIGVYGVEPDKAEAAVWYERATRYSEK